MKKLVLLCLAFLLCLMTGHALGDGPLTARISTDRDSYSRGDLITVTATVTNASARGVNDVRVVILTPEGCLPADGSSPVLEAGALAAGAVTGHTCVFRTESAVVPPLTGDRTPLLPLALGALASAVLLALSFSRRGRKLFALLLPLCLLPFAPVRAETAALRVSRTVLLEGEPIEVAAEITCAFSAEPVVLPDPEDISIVYPGREHLHALESGALYADNLIDLVAEGDAALSDVKALAAAHGAAVAGMIEVTGDYQLLLPSPLAWEELNALCAVLEASPLVASAAPEVLEKAECDATVFIPDDALWQPESAWSTLHPSGSNWNVEAIHAPEAWNVVLNSAHLPVKVGVIDSMFDTRHEDLAGRFEEVWNNDDSLSSDHGTHVSGIIGAAFNNARGIAGILPDARLYGYSVLGASTDADVSDPNKTFVNEYQYKFALAKMILSGCRVINVSMGAANPGGCAWQGEIDPFLTRLRERGCDFLIVQSAGNSGVDASLNGIFVNCAANRDRIVVVTAARLDSDAPSYSVTPSANWGERVDLAAPGQQILSCVPAGALYAAKNGTSMAAPHAAAVAALCYSVNPGLTGSQVKDILLRSAPFALSQTPPGADAPFSYPFVDAFSAVTLAAATAATEHGAATAGTVMGRVSPRNTGVRVSAWYAGTADLADTVSLMADGQFSLLLEEGEYDLTVSLQGYRTLTVKSVSVLAGKVTYLEDITLLRDAAADKGTVRGEAVDAVTGLPVAGTVVAFYPGWNVSASSAQGQCAAGDDGGFSLDLPEGHYTAVFSHAGYASARVNLTVFSGGTTFLTGALSPDQIAVRYRVILTWGEEPPDLDSHLTGVLADGSAMHVWYRATAARYNGVTVSTLDHDDTSSYGPETITLYIPDSGVFRYSVHNYTYRKDTANNSLANSSAQVAVYKGSVLVSVFPVPNLYGTVWNVFEIRDGTVIPLNTMEYITDPGDI